MRPQNLIQDDELTQDFSENENKDHSDVEARLLSSSADTSITDNTNSETVQELPKG